MLDQPHETAKHDQNAARLSRTVRKTYAIWAMGLLLGTGGLSFLIYYLFGLFGG